MSSFFDDAGSDETLNADKKLLFKEKDFVKFTVIDAKENTKNGDLILDCQINSGEHEGQRYSHFISDRDHEIAKKQKAQFLKAFWTIEELKSGKASPADLVAAEFQARAGKVRTSNGQEYQNFNQFKRTDKGTDPVIAAPPAEQAPVIAADGGVA